MGWEEYEPIVQEFQVPVVVTGFEPVDLLEGILMVVTQLERGEARVENQYSRVVRREGNRRAQENIRKVFRVTDRKWRGIGSIPLSGLELRPPFLDFDAEALFDLGAVEVDEPPVCISGEVLRGLCKPPECPAFGRECSPQSPLGATMVSSEGACASYFAYGRVKIRDV